MAKIFKMPEPESDWDYVLVAPDAAEGSASQDEITRWLELADIALRIDRNEAA